MDRNKKQNVPTNTAYDKNMNRVNSNDRNWAGGNGRSTDFEREEKNWGPVNEYHKDRKESPRYNKKPGTTFFKLNINLIFKNSKK